MKFILRDFELKGLAEKGKFCGTFAEDHKPLSAGAHLLQDPQAGQAVRHGVDHGHLSRGHKRS